MDCLSYRREVLQDPQSQAAQLVGHRNGCAVCARFTQELQQFEQSMRDAMQIDAPEGLASRIILHQQLAQRQPRKPVWLALAASVLLTVMLVFAFYPAQVSLQQVVLNHVNGELKHLHDQHNVSVSKLNQILLTQGTQIKQLTRTVNYAGACPIRDYKGTHMVLQGKRGVITVLLMPKEYTQGRQSFRDERFQGVIVPTNNGSMAIVAEDPQEINELEQELKQQLEFPAL